MPDKLHRCVDDLKNKGDVDNPWAVCNASIKEDLPIIETENCSVCGKTKEMHGTFSDHKYECNTLETVSIGGGLSAQSVGAKRIEEIQPCSCFDSVHEALLHETGYLPDDPDKPMPFKESDKTVTDPKTGKTVRVISDPSGLY